MNDETFEMDTVVLVDDDGVEQEFEILDTYEEGDNLYYALSPLSDDETDMVSAGQDLVVLKSVEEDGEELLATVDDDEEYDRIGGIFLTRLENLYFDDEEEEDN